MEKSELKQIETIQTLDEFGELFILFGVAVQLVVYFVTGSPLLSLISGIFGVVSVVLCSNRKVSFYIFGFIQLITYVILCLEQKLYGEIAENVFYFVTMIYGMFHWSNHYNDETQKVDTRNLNKLQRNLVFIGTALLTLGLYDILIATDDTQPFVDAVTTIPAFVAQILMIKRYKDSWYYWLIIDVGSIIMWAIAGDWCMVAQFVFWTANCIYGLKKW